MEKTTQMLYVYAGGDDGGDLRLAFKASCSTGEVKGPKQVAGDKKTPEGIYFLIDEYEDKYLSPVYGTKAFPTDYPNFMDELLGKNGSAIWIHGTDKALKPMDSNGCIALENDDIMTLSRYIDLYSTPLVIVEAAATISPQERNYLQMDLRNQLKAWASALGVGGYHQYLALYSPTYLPDIDFWKAWDKNRELLTKAGSEPVITLANIGLYHHQGVFVAFFDLWMGSKDQKMNLGKRQLFFKKEEGGYRIVGDVYKKKEAPYQKKGSYPLVIASTSLLKKPSGADEIMAGVEKWLEAWSAKNMKAYAGFYASDFVSDGLGKTAWVRRKTQLSRKYDY
ncbi:MAG: L,D-transpeptidase, partial [Desulfobacterales bacterium]|nr:L,D-transpeptidase [Desulfobacterales bacterium]